MSSTGKTDEFGPWKLLIEDNNEAKQNELDVNKAEKKVLSLPKTHKRQGSLISIHKRPRYQLDVPLKVRPLKLELEHEFLYGEIGNSKQTKTLSFDSPLVPFQNKNHRKRNKGKRAALSKEEPQQFFKKRVSKIDLLCEENEPIKNSHQSNTISFQYEFAKKRSIKEVLKYMRNPNLIPSPHLSSNLPPPTPAPNRSSSISQKYKEISSILSIDKADQYAPTRMKVFSYARKR